MIYVQCSYRTILLLSVSHDTVHQIKADQYRAKLIGQLGKSPILPEGGGRVVTTGHIGLCLPLHTHKEQTDTPSQALYTTQCTHIEKKIRWEIIFAWSQSNPNKIERKLGKSAQTLFCFLVVLEVWRMTELVTLGTYTTHWVTLIILQKMQKPCNKWKCQTNVYLQSQHYFYQLDSKWC